MNKLINCSTINQTRKQCADPWIPFGYTSVQLLLKQTSLHPGVSVDPTRVSIQTRRIRLSFLETQLILEWSKNKVEILISDKILRETGRSLSC